MIIVPPVTPAPVTRLQLKCSVCRQTPVIGKGCLERHDYAAAVETGQLHPQEVTVLGEPEPGEGPVWVWRGQFRAYAPTATEASRARSNHTGDADPVAPDPRWLGANDWPVQLRNPDDEHLVIYPYPYADTDPLSLPICLTFWCWVCGSEFSDVVPTIYRQIQGSRSRDVVISQDNIRAGARTTQDFDVQDLVRGALNGGEMPKRHTDD